MFFSGDYFLVNAVKVIKLIMIVTGAIVLIISIVLFLYNKNKTTAKNIRIKKYSIIGMIWGLGEILVAVFVLSSYINNIIFIS